VGDISADKNGAFKPFLFIFTNHANFFYRLLITKGNDPAASLKAGPSHLEGTDST
jgi:hypothetical protein